MSKLLYPCPCEEGTKCMLDRSCRGCEVYIAWCNKREKEVKAKELLQFQEHLNFASSIVKKWPEWKQKVLGKIV